MSIFDITEFPKSDFKKVQYFKSSVGNRIVRVINPEENYKCFAHYIKQTYIECLGKDECPICQNNVKIRAQFGKDAKDHGVNWPFQRFSVNVLERTPTILCPKCGAENYAGMNNRFSPTCPCGQIIAGIKPEPLNKVKLLSGGKELFAMLNGYDESQLNDEGEPLGLANFDINLMGLAQSDGKIKVTPIPMPYQDDVVVLPEGEELFDVSASILHFSVDEILELEKGTKIKDIFAARRTTTTETENEEVDEDTKSIAEDAANSIFNA